MALDVGTTLHGFIVKQVDRVALLDSVAIQFEHARTGLRLVHVLNDDVENLFSILVATPPADDKGIPHILEHSVLAGSEKYRAREGIFELVRRSLATYINAMTTQEHTVYPVCSTVPKDLFNLADVYWDAVFHPLLTEHTFRREGHRLEFERPTDAAGPLTVRGIVYSEMKGAMSGPDAQLGQALFQGLFPSSAYGYNSGGDPQSILALTHEELKAFHSKYYHPSRAIVLVYGRVPSEQYLAFVAERLDGIERGYEPIRIDRQPRFSVPRQVKIRCTVGPKEAGRAWLALGWVCGDGANPMDSMQLSLLDQVLMGHPGAELRKALLDGQWGDDIALHYPWTNALDAVLSFGVRGADAKKAPAFESFVLETLGRIVERGIPRDAIETAFQQLSYSTLAINNRFPIDLLWKISGHYLITGDPIAPLKAAEHLCTVRERALSDPSFLARLIQERLLDNPHRLLLVGEGDPSLGERRETEFAEQLRARKEAMTESQLNKISLDAEAFERLEQVKDAGGFDLLPKLSRNDLPRLSRRIATTMDVDRRFVFLNNEVFANGINYLQLDLDCSNLDLELLAYLELFVRCISKLGTRGRGWAATSSRVASVTSGVYGWVQLDAHATEDTEVLRTLHLGTSFLDGNADAVGLLLTELLFDPDFDDRERLRDVLIQLRAQGRDQLADRAAQLVRCHAARTLSIEAWLTDEVHGVPQLRRIDRIATGFQVRDEAIIENTLGLLKRVQLALARAPRIIASFTGSGSEREPLRRRLASWAKRAEAAPKANLLFSPEQRPSAVGFAGAMDVAFCSHALSAPNYGHPASAALDVATTYFSLYYLVDEIRLRGAAYGGGGSMDPFHRHLLFCSYRDPQPARTLGLLRQAAQSVERLDWESSQIERAVFNTVRGALEPNRPEESTQVALWWYLHGLTNELRQARYERLLAVDAAEARRVFCDLLTEQQGLASECVMGSLELLEQSNGILRGGALTIESVF